MSPLGTNGETKVENPEDDGKHRFGDLPGKDFNIQLDGAQEDLQNNRNAENMDGLNITLGCQKFGQK